MKQKFARIHFAAFRFNYFSSCLALHITQPVQQNNKAFATTSKYPMASQCLNTEIFETENLKLYTFESYIWAPATQFCPLEMLK